ncbi:4-oxalomesaconate tautomerase [Marinomonas piezotolerans]|uniref:4-oxalomesaconate tautomerase n=1 Tax=Marinomonas piezotolerans TaxID=2213058 RepID=A0A370U917_9GAMM|nr:4-oxalomesaconate tautomerase [Marinomonas piezotolerans]RDL44289.1 4-oxalomesaconate tautomerase [Marinomonas piezotolerans]
MGELTIPCMLMRGGTSRGPYLRLTDMPENRDQLAELLIKIMGSGHELQIDGLGGGNSLTSKVAMVGPSRTADADVEYLFAQVGIADKTVDFSPNCGNMLAGVAPFAVESGLVYANEGKTTVRIRNLNTNKLIHSTVLTPNKRVEYKGDVMISGANSPGAPIELTFLDVAGSKTGKLFPTGQKVDVIDGIPVTCIDAATPVMIVDASSLGKTGHEAPKDLDADDIFMQRLEALRRKAGLLMGMGDVSEKVIPKPILVSPPQTQGVICARYFVPNRCHKALAVTGSIAIVNALCNEGTLAQELVQAELGATAFKLEHPTGFIDLTANWQNGEVQSVSLVRTAKPIFSGLVYLN